MKNYQYRIISLVALIISAPAITACGGGDDSSTNAPVDQTQSADDLPGAKGAMVEAGRPATNEEEQHLREMI